MQNPYAPTQHASMPVPAPVQWLRVVVGAMAALITFYVIVVVTEMSFAIWLKPTGLPDRWVVNAVTYGSYYLLGGLIYWRVADGVYRHVLVHVLAMYLLIEVIDLGLMALLDLPSFPQDALGLFYRAISFPPALAAWALVSWQRRSA